MISPKTIRFSGGQFCFGVEALDDSAEKLFLGPKPVQQQGSVPPKHLGHFLHRFNLPAHCLGARLVQKLPGPVGRGVRPEQLTLFLKKVTPDRLQIVPQKICQFGVLFIGQVLQSLELQPAHFRRHRLVAFLHQFFPFPGPEALT